MTLADRRKRRSDGVPGQQPAPWAGVRKPLVSAVAVLGIGLLALTVWLTLRSRPPAEPPVAAPQAPREAFHASKPLRVLVTLQGSDAERSSQHEWLERELRYLLARGKMRIAPIGPDPDSIFTLHLDLAGDARSAQLTLVAPDDVIERQENIALSETGALPTVRALAARLPQFLSAVDTADWTALIGTQDAEAYETYVHSATELLGSAGRGFTRPVATQSAKTIEHLEELTKKDPQFARAAATLAIGYLSLGGEDQNSLTQLAYSAAHGALKVDSDLPEAHAAAGLVNLRQNDWVAAYEQLDRALSLDANLAPALEGLACLSVDAGQTRAALPIAQRAVTLQPQNTGARECLIYARLAASPETVEAAATHDAKTPGEARIHALVGLASGSESSARQLLDAAQARDLRSWVEPLVNAAKNGAEVRHALQAVTRSANDGAIDPFTEILAGVALRQSDFVFNRMSRLQRQREHAPLRILWLPQTSFLRQNARFEEIVSAAALPAFWQKHGTPDVCAQEPTVYGCNLAQKPAATRPSL
jgi:tetratricopeptide (TPR) repeat protein